MRRRRRRRTRARSLDASCSNSRLGVRTSRRERWRRRGRCCGTERRWTSLRRRRGTDGESVDAKADVERMREIERGLDEDAREYEEWIREAETETKAVEAETKAEAQIEDALGVAQALDEASTEVDARAQRTIARPPAPPLPKNERAPAPPAPSAPVVKRKRLAVSNARRHKGDMEKWAKVRESEKIVGEGASAIKAKQAKEAEEWRVQQLVDGVDGSTNPNFVPVGDWRARVRAAGKHQTRTVPRASRGKSERVVQAEMRRCADSKRDSTSSGLARIRGRGVGR